MGKRTGVRKGARRSGNPARREAAGLFSGKVAGERLYASAAPRAGVQPGEAIAVPVPELPAGVVIREAVSTDAAPLTPVIRMADPDNPQGSWRVVAQMIEQSTDADSPTHVLVAHETTNGTLVGGAVAFPSTWVFTHPLLAGSPNAHILAGLVAHIDSLAVIQQWRGHGIARALVARAEAAMGTSDPGKLSAAVTYVTHEPELTDFYAGLGYTLSPDGIAIPTPSGLICHGPTDGYHFSVKPLRTAVQLHPESTPYGPHLVIRGILPRPT